MTQQAAPDYFELSDYTSALRRHWLTVAVLTLIGTALAVAYVVVAPPKYTSTVLVQVNALPNSANQLGGRTGGPVNMDNEAQLAQSASVAAMVKAELHSPLSEAAISQALKVSVPPNSTYLAITCAWHSAVGARNCANATGKAYLNARRLSILHLVGSGLQAQRTAEAKQRQNIIRLKVLVFSGRHKRSNPSGSPTQIDDSLQLEAAHKALDSLEATYNSALSLYQSMSVPGSPIVGSIATAAALPAAPSSPRKLLYVPSGLIAGLLIGLAAAFIKDRRDKRVHAARDVERVTGLPDVLALPAGPAMAVTGLESSRGRAGQAFSELAQQIAITLGEGSHVIVVAATSPGPSGSVVAANLGAALARTVGETVIVTASPSESAAADLLGLRSARGLSDYVAGKATAAEASPGGNLPRLRLVGAGQSYNGSTASVMNPARVRKLVTELLGTVQFVVIEAQSVGDAADTFSLTALGEAAVIAVETGRSRTDDVLACSRRLTALGVHVLGTAVVGPMSARAAGRAAAAAAPAQPEQAPADLSPIRRYER
ncbi:MAG TPA: Wzz/FepE/Etk N-terminal domain-containing protein, partial [Streptosporangiaceae bacterium]